MRLTPTILVLLLFIALGATLSNGCSKNPGAEQPAPINFVVPPGFPQPRQIWASGPLSEEAFVLGRKLFFDGRLSKDGQFPCSSCHQPVAAYTTFEHDRSHGYNHSHTLRNAPGLFNLAWSPELNQDGSGRSLAWTSDIGPHWCPPDFLEWPGYERLWANAINWLAGRS